MNGSTVRLDPPKLSIIAVAYNAAATIERCLAALTAQHGRDALEIIVVDSGQDETAQIVAVRFPEVRLIRCATRQYPGAARNIGIASARADLIGFVDADCVAAPDWGARVINAHCDSAAAIGGIIDNASRGSRVAWARYLCEFHQWMPGTRAGPMDDIPTCCLSLKRWAFERYGPFRSDDYCSDTAFNWMLTRHGFPPRLDPAIRVAHLDDTSLGAFGRKQVMHGHAFARMRIAEQAFSTSRRLLYLLLSPVMPLVLFARLAKRVLVDRRQYRTEFLAAVPLVFLGLCLWSIGEAAGYAKRG